MARWMTLNKVPFNHYFGPGAVTVWREPGEFYEKDEVVDAAVAGRYATEGKADDSPARSTKGRTRRSKGSKATADASAADTGPDNGMAAADMAAADSPGDRRGVDEAAG